MRDKFLNLYYFSRLIFHFTLRLRWHHFYKKYVTRHIYEEVLPKLMKSFIFFKCRYIPHLLIVRAIIFKMFILLIMVHRFNTISFKALVGYYLDINKLILESNALHQTLNDNKILKKNIVRIQLLLNFQTVYEAAVINKVQLYLNLLLLSPICMTCRILVC